MAEVETLNPWLGLAGPILGAVGGFLLYLSSRRGQDKTGEGGFRGDLLKRIDQLEAEQRKDEARIDQLQTRNDELREENHVLKADNRSLASQVLDLTKRLEVLESRRNGAGEQL